MSPSPTSRRDKNPWWGLPQGDSVSEFKLTSFSSVYFYFNKHPVLSCICLTLEFFLGGRQEPGFCFGLSPHQDIPESFRWHSYHPIKGVFNGEFSCLVYLKLLHVLSIKVNYFNGRHCHILEKQVLWYLIKHWFPLSSMKKLIKKSNDGTAGKKWQLYIMRIIEKS